MQLEVGQVGGKQQNTDPSGAQVVLELTRIRKMGRETKRGFSNSCTLNGFSNPPALQEGLKTHYRARAFIWGPLGTITKY